MPTTGHHLCSSRVANEHNMTWSYLLILLPVVIRYFHLLGMILNLLHMSYIDLLAPLLAYGRSLHTPRSSSSILLIGLLYCIHSPFSFSLPSRVLPPVSFSCVRAFLWLGLWKQVYIETSPGFVSRVCGKNSRTILLQSHDQVAMPLTDFFSSSVSMVIPSHGRSRNPTTKTANTISWDHPQYRWKPVHSDSYLNSTTSCSEAASPSAPRSPPPEPVSVHSLRRDTSPTRAFVVSGVVPSGRCAV